jgi:site-specific DNA recombinase
MKMSKKIKTEVDILKDIQSGIYRDFYVIYNRKSTDEANNQKNSISYQKSENGRYAHRERLPIAPITLKSFCTDGIVSEKHSGFKEGDDLSISDDGVVQYRIDRPKFHQLLQYVNHGYFKGIICLCWDRISRNKGDDTIIRKLMRRGVDIRFVYASYDKSSAGELHMDIDGMFAQHHSRVTSEKVTMTTRNSRSKGKCTYRAPIGYLNEGNMDYKPLDPVRAPVIKEMFRLYATGEWSLADIARYASEQGFTTVPMRRRRSKEEMLADEDEEDVQIEKTSRPLLKITSVAF